MLDQQDDKETKEYCAQLTTTYISFVRKKIEAVWLSFARNQAIALCNTDILLCIDADAIADEQRAYELTETFSYDDRIALVWGKILPKFHAAPPFLMQLNFVYDMYSLLDRGNEVAPFSKVVGASYGIHIARMWKEAYLDLQLWRKPWVLLWGEETDLCMRAKALNLLIYYTWKAVVYHQILPERLTYIWIFKRTYRGWYSRAVQWGMPQPNSMQKKTWRMLLGLLLAPFYAVGYVRGWRLKKSEFIL